ncbi:phosphoribosyltransferase [Candidatus Bathyarchaeota archaeon]|nr:phosphoribosyltransferase [Candidatus Bathyarchaeota archaeon]
MSWDSFYSTSRITADKIIESNYKPDVIIGLARGGWFFARVLCDFLEVKDLLSLKVEHWGFTATPDGEAKIKYPLETDLSGLKVLIVDDISDTGKSLTVATLHVEKLNPKEVKTATLIYLTGSNFKPDYYGNEITWRWVVFPWNYYEDMCNLVPKISEGVVSYQDMLKNMKERFSLELTEEELVKILNEIKRRKS